MYPVIRSGVKSRNEDRAQRRSSYFRSPAVKGLEGSAKK